MISASVASRSPRPDSCAVYQTPLYFTNSPVSRLSESVSSVIAIAVGSINLKARTYVDRAGRWGRNGVLRLVNFAVQDSLVLDREQTIVVHLHQSEAMRPFERGKLHVIGR